MSIALLVQTQVELRRLSVAGSRFAVGDFRIERLIDPLATVGAKVPVFAKIADLLRALIAAQATASSALLVQASGLVTAVLATQGRSQAEGQSEPLLGREQAVPPMTDGSARRLRPVVEALTTTGSGRLEIIEDALVHKLFDDFRLMRLAIDHLEDPYPPVADCIALKVLPTYGAAIIPKLRASLDMKGGPRHARALRSIHAIEGSQAFELLAQALEEGSSDIRVAAVECLASQPSAKPLLLAHAKDRNKDVRQAVVHALGSQVGSDVVGLLMEALKGAEVHAAVSSITRNASPELSIALAGSVREFAKAALGEGRTDADLRRLRAGLTCCIRRDHADIHQVLRELELQCDDLLAIPEDPKSRSMSGKDLVDLLVNALAESSDIGLRRAVKARCETLEGAAKRVAVRLLFADEDPGAVYDRLAPQVGKGKRKRGDLIDALPNEANWDPRWLDLGLSLDEERIILPCLRSDHPDCIVWLRQRHEKAKTIGTKYLEPLILLQVPDALELFIESVQNASTHWYGRSVYYLAKHFPPSDLPRFEELAKSLSDDATLAFLDALEPLRTAAKT